MTASRSRAHLIVLSVLLGACRPGLEAVPPEHDPANPEAPVPRWSTEDGGLDQTAFDEALPKDEGHGHHHHHHGAMKKGASK